MQNYKAIWNIRKQNTKKILEIRSEQAHYLRHEMVIKVYPVILKTYVDFNETKVKNNMIR